MPVPKLIVPQRFSDERGWFVESYSKRHLAEIGVHEEFVQDNHSYSVAKGTLRGIHFQALPRAQAKLVRCLSGAIWDVAVDLRRGSPSFGKWLAAELTSARGEQLYIPVGFGHGFLTLTNNAEVAYKTSDHYAPECDAGIAWDCPDLAISWPLGELLPALSDKDRHLPRLSGWTSTFEYDGEPMERLA